MASTEPRSGSKEKASDPPPASTLEGAGGRPPSLSWWGAEPIKPRTELRAEKRVEVLQGRGRGWPVGADGAPAPPRNHHPKIHTHAIVFAKTGEQSPLQFELVLKSYTAGHVTSPYHCICALRASMSGFW